MFKKFLERKKSQPPKKHQPLIEATPTGNVRYTVNYQIRALIGNEVMKTDSFSGKSTKNDVDDVIEQRAIKIVRSSDGIFIEITRILIEAEEKIAGAEEVRYSVVRNQTFNGITAPLFFDYMG